MTNRKDLYEKLLVLRSHGITKDGSRFTSRESQNAGRWYYEQQSLGFNYRITDIQCALGVSQLAKLDKFINKRRKIARIYDKILAAVSGIELPQEREYAESAWHLYPIRIKDENRRKTIFDNLRSKGVRVQVHYLPVYLHPYYQNLGYEKGLCPLAEDFYQREISLPLYPAMNKKDVGYAARVVTDEFKR